MVLVEDIIEKFHQLPINGVTKIIFQKLDAVGKLIILMMICSMLLHQGRNTITYTKGLMNGVASEEEVAFVIAHEIAHHLGNHVANAQRNILLGSLAGRVLGTVIDGSDDLISQTTDLGARFGSLVFSRDQEKEADYFSLLIF